MKDNSLDFLERFVNSASPSGFETEASRIWVEEAKKFAEEVYRDVHGNSIARINGGGTPRIMLAGHVDEIGLMVSYIDDNGFIYFREIGGWDSQILPGQRVSILTNSGRISGVIGRKPIHTLKEEERKKAVKPEELWIDVGARDGKECKNFISVGDSVIMDRGFSRLRNELVVGRGFDDKVGASVALEAARLLTELKPSAEIYAVATVQEEIGLRGAITSAFGIAPKVGIAIDVTPASDIPGGDKKIGGDISLGKGPVIERGANINQRVFDILRKTAEDRKIPYQISGSPRGTGTDANAIQISRGGVATGLVSIPNRYMHSPCELVDLEDVENSYKLLAYAIEEINEKTDFLPF